MPHKRRKQWRIAARVARDRRGNSANANAKVKVNSEEPESELWSRKSKSGPLEELKIICGVCGPTTLDSSSHLRQGQECRKRLNSRSSFKAKMVKEKLHEEEEPSSSSETETSSLLSTSSSSSEDDVFDSCHQESSPKTPISSVALEKYFEGPMDISGILSSPESPSLNETKPEPNVGNVVTVKRTVEENEFKVWVSTDPFVMTTTSSPIEFGPAEPALLPDPTSISFATNANSERTKDFGNSGELNASEAQLPSLQTTKSEETFAPELNIEQGGSLGLPIIRGAHGVYGFPETVFETKNALKNISILAEKVVTQLELCEECLIEQNRANKASAAASKCVHSVSGTTGKAEQCNNVDDYHQAVEEIQIQEIEQTPETSERRVKTHGYTACPVRWTDYIHLFDDETVTGRRLWASAYQKDLEVVKTQDLQKVPDSDIDITGGGDNVDSMITNFASNPRPESPAKEGDVTTVKAVSVESAETSSDNEKDNHEERGPFRRFAHFLAKRLTSPCLKLK